MRKEKILVIDENQENIDTLELILVDDYQTISVSNAEKALKLIGSNPPISLILLNIQLSDTDSFEFCLKIKGHYHSKNIPIILVTDHIDEETEKMGLIVGAEDYIIKPFNQLTVKVKLKNHLALKQQRELLINLAKQDELTGINSYSRFCDFLEDEWQRAIRGQTCLSMILVDINFFNQFNKHYGYVAGDQCLKKVAQAIKHSVPRKVDLVARYSSDIFVCLLPNTDYTGALHLAERIHSSVENLYIAHEKSSSDKFINVSMGVSESQPNLFSVSFSLVEETNKMLVETKENERKSEDDYMQRLLALERMI